MSLGDRECLRTMGAEEMTEEELKNLAIDCGALVRPHPKVEEVTLITFTMEELLEFIENLTGEQK